MKKFACIYKSIESMIKTNKNLGKLKTTLYRELPTVKKILNRIREDVREDSTTYSSYEIMNVSSSNEYFERHFVS